MLAGGRYNGLVEELGGPEMPGVGFGLGVERLVLLMQAEQVAIPDNHPLDVYVVGIGDQTSLATLKIVQAIRQSGLTADRDYLDRKPKAQFKTANRLNAAYTLTIGEQELADHTANLKSMATGEEISVPLADIYQDFQNVVATKFTAK